MVILNIRIKVIYYSFFLNTEIMNTNCSLNKSNAQGFYYKLARFKHIGVGRFFIFRIVFYKFRSSARETITLD